MTYDEALAGGVPLLCRKDDCLKDVITEGTNGWQYENEAMYIECIRKWRELNEYEKQSIRNAAVQAADQFSSEKFCRTGGTGLSCSTGSKKKTCMQLNNVGMKDIDTNHLNRKVKEPKMMTRLWNVVSVIGLLTCLVLALWAYKSGILDSVETFGRHLSGNFGYGGMAVFVLVQIIQVVIPILPGGISCLGGVILFGPWLGFLYNYVGICIGSMAAFGNLQSHGKTGSFIK